MDMNLELEKGRDEKQFYRLNPDKDKHCHQKESFNIQLWQMPSEDHFYPMLNKDKHTINKLNLDSKLFSKRLKKNTQL